MSSWLEEGLNIYLWMLWFYRSIVERLCSDLDRKEPRYKSPTLLYFTFTAF